MRTGLTIVLLAAIHAVAHPAAAADSPAATATAWKVGAPIVTYWAGPAMTDQVARQMAEGGFNSSGARNRSSTWPSGTVFGRSSATGCSPRPRWTIRPGVRSSTP